MITGLRRKLSSLSLSVDEAFDSGAENRLRSVRLNATQRFSSLLARGFSTGSWNGESSGSSSCGEEDDASGWSRDACGRVYVGVSSGAPYEGVWGAGDDEPFSHVKSWSRQLSQTEKFYAHCRDGNPRGCKCNCGVGGVGEVGCDRGEGGENYHKVSPCKSNYSKSRRFFRSEEPVASNMDISTGHIVLAYMEDHMKNTDRLTEEWQNLSTYEAEPNDTKIASETANVRKNRYGDILPYDHSRVILDVANNISGCDYINANNITDHDPRSPAYVATQGPLPHTVADFWQLVWEQGSVVIVNLTTLSENGTTMCHRYWPEEGSDLYHIYEVHLVSEHIWCDDYLVRSFYLKNLQTNETRTVTQFNYITWPDLGVPASVKSILDFRRKVNKSYRGRSCPIIVHGSDGVGRTGTYCLLDMVLNRMNKGAKEIDIAATLEHIRDQRCGMVKTKEQFEFTLAAVAEEVHAILKALPQ